MSYLIKTCPRKIIFQLHLMRESKMFNGMYSILEIWKTNSTIYLIAIMIILELTFHQTSKALDTRMIIKAVIGKM